MPARLLSALLASACLVLIGCGTLPDAAPFADASRSLATATRASGHALTDSMSEAGALVAADKATYEQLSKDFAAAWGVRVAAVQVVVGYSEAIADLVAAGRQGGEAAGKVADSLKTLVESVGIPLAGPAFGVASDLARFLADRVAIVRASARLEAAVAQAQPAVDRVAEHIVSESERQLKPILINVSKNIISSIRGLYGGDDDFAVALAKKMTQPRQAALGDPLTLPQLREFDRTQAEVAARLQERDRRLEQAANLFKTRMALLNALSSATLSWAQAHRDLAAAILAKRRVSVAELQSSIVELKRLTQKVSEL